MGAGWACCSQDNEDDTATSANEQQQYTPIANHLVTDVIRSQRWPALATPLINNNNNVSVNTPPNDSATGDSNTDGDDHDVITPAIHTPVHRGSHLSRTESDAQPPQPSGLARLLRGGGAGQDKSVRFAEPLRENDSRNGSARVVSATIAPGQSWGQTPARDVLALLTRAESLTSQQEQSPTFFFNSLTSTAPMSPTSLEAGATFLS